MFDHQAGVYQLTWSEENIVIRVDRLHNSKTGLTGEILIKNTIPGMRPHLHGPIHFNFLSSTTRKQLSNHLKELIPLDWSGILEQLCYNVVETHRQGAPTINIAGYEMPDRLGMRIDPILQEKQTSVFFGDGDSLKSYFATYLSVLVKLGMSHNGLTPEPGNVLYLDYETDADTFWERINLISAGLGVGMPDGIYYRHEVESVVDDISGIQNAVKDNNISFVVVDSAAPATIEPEKAEYVIPFFRALRSLDATCAIVAHQIKIVKGEYPFGSIFWRNLPRTNYHVKADRNQEDVAISLKHTKSNNGRRLKPLGFQFHFTEDSVEITTAQPLQYDDLAKDVPVAQRLCYVLNKPMTITEAAELVNESADTVGRTFRRGKGTLFFNNGHLWAKIHV